MYDRAVDFWNIITEVLVKLQPANQRFWTVFWGAHQRFFRQMLMAAKVGVLYPRSTAVQQCSGRALPLAHLCRCTPERCLWPPRQREIV
jgi:hypothetical protein